MKILGIQIGKAHKAPSDVEKFTKTACKDMDHRRPEVVELLEMWRGNQWVKRNRSGSKVIDVPTRRGADGGKEPHRIRNTWNIIHGIIEGKVSAATQRTPGYQVNPSKSDPNITGAARLAERAAHHGYVKWRLRRARTKAVELALVTGEGFYYPIFDPSVGPFVPMIDESGQALVDPKTGQRKHMGTGEIKVLVLPPDSVSWDHGVEFEEARRYVIRRSLPPEEIKRLPGYLGGDLKADAVEHDIVGRGTPEADLTALIEYLERPCADYPQGRRIVMANGRQVLPEEPYPLVDAQGKVHDEPPLVRLGYTVDPLLDHDRGLVCHLMDPQRTVNDCQSKISEYKNRTLIPQLLAPRGSRPSRRTDIPGDLIEYDVVGGKAPEWEKPVQIPPELFTLMDAARNYMLEISAASDIPNQIESGRGVQAYLEQLQSRWAAFIADVAATDAEVMRRCLMLVQRYYTEPRVLQLRGSLGFDREDDFRGADLMGQADVTVLPSSLAARTREEVQQLVQWIAQVFPGYLRPEVALSAIHAGQGEQLIDDYERDISRAWSVIQQLKAGPEAFLNAPTVTAPDGVTEVPAWAPREFDNVDVHMAVMEAWMKSAEFADDIDEVTREAATLVYQALRDLRNTRDAEEAARQTAMAQQLGEANAAKPTSAPMPSLPSP